MRVPTHFKLDKRGHISVVYIRKNACSILKSMIVDDVGDNPQGLAPIQLMGKYRRCDVRDVMAAEKRIFILRDPAERIVSGWLNQVVMKFGGDYPDMFDGIEKAVGKPKARITFRDFVEKYLGGTVNGHFTPVIDHLLPITYTHVLHDLSLLDDARDALGPTYAERYFHRRMNSTAKLPSLQMKEAPDMPMGALYRLYRSENALPEKTSFLTPELRAEIDRKYAADTRMYRDYLSARRDGPIPVDASPYFHPA